MVMVLRNTQALAGVIGVIAVLLWPGARAFDTASLIFKSHRQASSAEAPVNAVSLHLFGNVQATAQTGLAISAQGLEMRGVIASGNNPHTGAVIAAEGQEKFYRVGETLPGGTMLAEIHESWVMLSNNGGREQLAMPRNNLPDLASSASQPVSASALNFAGPR